MRKDILRTMQHHRYSFFGQKVGLLLDSADWNDPSFYLRFLKKKQEGYWEKPSKKEGKNIKLNLLELIAILNLLEDTNNTTNKWSTVHRFGQETTPITFERRNEALTISVPGYQKYLKFPETKLLADLLRHIYGEKIVYATKNDLAKKDAVQSDKEHHWQVKKSPQVQENHQKRKEPTTNFYDKNGQSPANLTNPSPPQNYSAWISSLEQKNDCYLVPGEIQTRSERAVAFQIEGHKSTWVPLSCISQAIDTENIKGLWIKQWFIDKKAEEILAS